MPGNLWTAPAQQLAPGTSVAQNNYTAAQGVPAGESVLQAPVVYGNTLQPGSIIDVEGWGVMSNTGTPTVTLGLYLGGLASGGAVGGVTLVVSVAKTTTTAMSNWEFHYWWTGRILTTGTSGTILGSGYWRLPTSLTGWTEARWPETAPAAVTIDTTVNKSLVLGIAWSAASASNTATLHEHKVLVHG